MNKIVNTLVFCLLVVSGYGQIIHEQTYDHSGTYTRLTNSGVKIFVMDVGLNQCRIYNPDHSLWKTINLNMPPDHYLYDIQYVSENLFATDNSLYLAYIYYNYNTIGQYYTFTASITKEDGTELINISGCQYLFVHSLEEEGARLLAYSFDYSVFPYTVQTHAYHLPGNIMVLPGDCNCDGVVNMLDVVVTLNFVMGQSPVPFCFSNGDVNQDGIINILDAVSTVNIIMGGSI
jgi:hypothetical protein